MDGRLTKARAIDIRCLWPPDKLALPTMSLLAYIGSLGFVRTYGVKTLGQAPDEVAIGLSGGFLDV